IADEYDQPTSDITKDKCSKCLSGCKFRNNVGNFGGFLSINKLSQFCRVTIHKFRCVPHLTGRRFEHGVTDCYTLFRDAYHLAGIEMPDFHRGDDWWRHGQNLYLDNLEATGLYQVPLSSAQPGDVLLCCFGSSVPNHAAIYCGDGELLHHIPEQLSKRERYTDKWQRRTHSLWRHRAWHASAFTGICNDLAAASTFV
ncbi:TPA: NlpC/P60 family protein, partial [Escherichia coli]